ncbi:MULTISPECIES: acyl-CoA dehydrogenase family protein [unclassified Streptomyces]|uniref:acyl-CoA dehydrogenase family protein n=1 Tax=unclassified Streptomyces TaxID=2593676 RepID=UPI002E76CBF6|nr:MULTISPECIES: hydrolase [unclassified Streptomyces]MEE1758255.1 hydrolase [Streptomyces sp. SP18BB07]MEE1832689.1 hydrolase [Streptomyces sp. SP17KL33]
MQPQGSQASGLVERSAELAELARHRAQDAEEQRRLTPDVVARMLRTGFARHFAPAARGGADGTFEELTAAVATLAEGCAATAWCASIAASLARMAAYLPQEAHADVWADGPDTFVVGSLSPFGRATRESGGWRVSGSWAYISGVDHSDWALVCAVVPEERAAGESAGGPPPARLYALPRAAYAVKDTWASSGMCGTGSNTLVVDDVFVPETHSFERQRLFDGQPLGSSAHCHTVPLQAANGLSFAVPAVGAARGALKTWTGDTALRLRRGAGGPGVPGPTRGTYEATLARGAGELDAAELLLQRASRIADRGARVTADQTARNLRDCSLSAELAVTAVNRLFTTAGTSGHALGSPLQRTWRDVNSIATHVALAFDPAAKLYADRAFGG